MKNRSTSAPRKKRRGQQPIQEDDDYLSPAEIRELKRRIRDSKDPTRYMLVSEFSRRFILYYNVSDDVYAMNEPTAGTLFKRRKAAESVRRLLGGGVSVVKYTKSGKNLKRLSPYRSWRF